ncbi:MAG: hypothetical protein HYX69_09360 [Planctomycetia bacterium]|nr:hypothetical protein [Planctomycetia bacterium]
MRAPLPLVPFESYMLADDTSDYPMAFYLRLSFRGQLDRDRFTRALKEAAARHPLLQSIVRDIDGQACWVPADDPTPHLQWAPLDEPVNRQYGLLDIRRQVGMRAWVRAGASRTNVLVEFHHACCDGIAAMQFVEDLLACYVAMAPGDEKAGVPSRPLELARLHGRARFGVGLLARLLRAPLAILSAVGLAEFFWNRPVPVAASRYPDPGGDDPHKAAHSPAFHSHRFDRRQLANLRRVAERLGVTVNDLLVRDLLLAVDQWNQRHDQPHGCLRITMPINMRTQQDARLPAANVVSMAFIDRKPGRYATPRRLLGSVRRDTGLIKRFRMGLTFVSFISLLSRFRRALAALVSARRCMATAVLSNLGVQLDKLGLPRVHGRVDIGDGTLEEIEFLPPIRRLTRVAVGAITYADEQACRRRTGGKVGQAPRRNVGLKGLALFMLGASPIFPPRHFEKQNGPGDSAAVRWRGPGPVC